jgi:hypothetical protein
MAASFFVTAPSQEEAQQQAAPHHIWQEAQEDLQHHYGWQMLT